METIKKEMNPKPADEAVATAKNENRWYSPGLRALLSMRNCKINFEKEYEELLEIEAQLDDINKTGMLLIATHCNTEMQVNWKEQVDKGNEAIASLNKTLLDEKEKIEKKAVTNFTDLWKSMSSDVKKLRESSKKFGSLGFELMPEIVHASWESEYLNLQTRLVELVISHVESCWVLHRMIEKYTPEELNIINEIVVDKIPLDFTYKQAVVYEKDYFKALVDFKQEFEEEKPLWDKFLDILAGGTHQQPSERVMMERWIEGEKGDLS